MPDFLSLAIKVISMVIAFDLLVLGVLALSARFRGYQRDRLLSDRKIRSERDSYQRVLRSVSSSLAPAPVVAKGKGAVPTS